MNKSGFKGSVVCIFTTSFSDHYLSNMVARSKKLMCQFSGIGSFQSNLVKVCVLLGLVDSVNLILILPLPINIQGGEFP